MLSLCLPTNQQQHTGLASYTDNFSMGFLKPWKLPLAHKFSTSSVMVSINSLAADTPKGTKITAKKLLLVNKLPSGTEISCNL